MLALHRPGDVYQLRHTVSWMLLAAAAGAVNTMAFLACEQYVAHLTGTVMRLGLRESEQLLSDYFLVLAWFVMGAMASTVAIDRRYLRGKRPLYAVPLVMVAAMLTGVAVAGSRGAFGEFGAEGKTFESYVFLSVLAFSMGLQNAAVATSTGLMVRTTHLTGPATDLGVHLASAAFASGEARLSALRAAGLRAGKIFGFLIGVIAAVPLASRYDFLSFLLPASLVLVATAISFLPDDTFEAQAADSGSTSR